MPARTEYDKRVAAIHLRRSGFTSTAVAQEMGRSRAWVSKWWRRYQERQRFADLQDRSRAPKCSPQSIPAEVRQAVQRIRSELEAEAEVARPGVLSYIGAPAIRSRLQQEGLQSLPSRASIERILAQAGLTHPHAAAPAPDVVYPHLQPRQPHQVVQVDIVPHFLPGGQCVSCFNAIDPVSHYPNGQQAGSKNAGVAMQFLQQVWAEQDIPIYTQLDNESCFSGGTAHARVLSKVVRLCLFVGTQPVFTPFYHPESNGCVERFHQDYNRHTWDKFTLDALETVQHCSQPFFESFRQSGHVEALAGRSPAEVHAQTQGFRLPSSWTPPSPKLPLTAGQIHFIRRVSAEQTVTILCQSWAVPKAQPDQGVWATLTLTLQGATLRIWDAAPDADARTCLAQHPFPLQEPVLPLRPEFQRPRPSQPSWFAQAAGWVGATVRSQLTGWLSTMF